MKKLLFLTLSALTFSAVCSELRDLVNAAVKEKKNSITLEKKTYRLKKSVKLENLKGFTINGNGAEIVMLNNTICAFP